MALLVAGGPADTAEFNPIEHAPRTVALNGVIQDKSGAAIDGAPVKHDPGSGNHIIRGPGAPTSMTKWGVVGNELQTDPDASTFNQRDGQALL